MNTTQCEQPTLSTWWRRYRIVRDAYLGYEVQHWYIWWPFWTQGWDINTHSTIEKAEQYAAYRADEDRDVVKYL